MIAPRLTFFVEDFVISCKSPCHFRSQADFAISVFREVSINTVFPGCHLQDVPYLSREMFAAAGVSPVPRFSVKSSSHTETTLTLLFRAVCTRQFPGASSLLRGFAGMLMLLYPEEAMSRTSSCWN